MLCGPAPLRAVSSVWPVASVSEQVSPVPLQPAGGWVDTPVYSDVDAEVPWGAPRAFTPFWPPAVHHKATMRLRDLSGVHPEVEVVHAGDSACGKVVALAQTHGGYMTTVSHLAILRELVALQPRHIFVEGALQDGDAKLVQTVRQRVLETLRKAGDDPARQGADFLLLMGEVGAGAVYAAFVDPTVKLRAADVPRDVRVQARARGGNKALADVTFNVRERKVFTDVASTLRCEPGCSIAIIYGYGHDFRRIGGEFLGRDGFDPNFIWKNTSGCDMAEVRAIRQEAQNFLAGKPQKKVDYKMEIDEAHPPYRDAFLQNFLRDIQASSAAA